MSKLDELRLEIDKIDNELVKIFLKRMEISKEIGLEKKKLCKEIFDKNREEEVLNNILSQVSDDKKQYVKDLYLSIFKISKECQSEENIK